FKLDVLHPARFGDRERLHVLTPFRLPTSQIQARGSNGSPCHSASRVWRRISSSVSSMGGGSKGRGDGASSWSSSGRSRAANSRRSSSGGGEGPAGTAGGGRRKALASRSSAGHW